MSPRKVWMPPAIKLYRIVTVTDAAIVDIEATCQQVSLLLFHPLGTWLTSEHMSIGAAPHLKIIVKSSTTTVRVVAAIPVAYAAMANLDGFESPESTALLASGSSEAAPGALDSNIATKSKENNNVGVEQLEYLDALSSPLQYPQSPTA
jgi:hypothetical protein